ncbi:ATP-binding protein [Streptomyces sp. NPDC047081]|uniref:sensor histidine kinase n=1 Tax=Streptomyces sp. NPDC047081 TaxID=3154706 RepID=UPI0033C34CDF
MTAPTLPGERPSLRSLAPVPLLTAVLAALAVAGAVALAPRSQRAELGLGASIGALLLCVAVTVATRAVVTARITRRRLEAVTADTGRLLQDRIRQSAEFDQERARLTEELTHERGRLAAELVHERAVLSAEFTEERARLTAENGRLAERARRADQERAAAISATANAAGRMQALATGMLADLRAMEERHDDEDVLADLLHLDHRTAQAGRLADSVAVLAGARSGRRWARPIGMESILRGAMGRISGYRRVRVHSASEAAVAGHAAEGVMHALAELLDNAANFSPPTAEVHVYVEEVPAGVIVSVEDSGLVMGDVQLRRAERAVSGDETDLGGLTGTRLGLAVVGRLSRKYGLKVSYRPSARGGTGVLMLVPQDILVPEQYVSGNGPQEGLTLPRVGVAGRVADDGQGGPGSGELPLPVDGQVRKSADGTPRMPADGKPWVSGDEPGPGSSNGHARVAYDGHAHVSDDEHRSGGGLDGSGTHEAADRGAGSLGDGLPVALPKRRRGRALAEAERERERARARAAEFDRERGRTRARADGFDGFGDADPSAPESARISLDDPLARAARFSSFRRAVRGSLSDQAPPAPDADAHGIDVHTAHGFETRDRMPDTTEATEARAPHTPEPATPTPSLPAPSHQEGPTTS